MDRTESPNRSAEAAAAVLDWRIQTFALYAEIRTAALDDPAAAHRLWRQRRDELFRAHPASALSEAKKSSFDSLPVLPYDPGFRFNCRLTPAGAGATMLVPTGTDGVVPLSRLGSFEIPGLGLLAAWKLDSYGGGIFVPFRDGTSGRTGGSYGGGRYLLDSIKGAFLGATDSIFVLDFNFAYNPSCAYNEEWACPLPGPANRIAAEVGAGEIYHPGLAGQVGDTGAAP